MDVVPIWVSSCLRNMLWYGRSPPRNVSQSPPVSPTSRPCLCKERSCAGEDVSPCLSESWGPWAPSKFFGLLSIHGKFLPCLLVPSIPRKGRKQAVSVPGPSCWPSGFRPVNLRPSAMSLPLTSVQQSMLGEGVTSPGKAPPPPPPGGSFLCPRSFHPTEFLALGPAPHFTMTLGWSLDCPAQPVCPSLKRRVE